MALLTQQSQVMMLNLWFLSDFDIMQLTDCTPRKLFLLSRHGTTLPIVSEIDRMLDIHERLKVRVLENYDAGRTQLCRQDIENIRNWTISPDVQPERSFELTQQGWNEFRDLGTRWSEAFPTVLPRTYNPSQFLFRAYGNTSVNGLQGFAEGIFGEWENIVFAPATDPDILLMVKRT